MTMWTENDLSNARITGESDEGWTVEQMEAMNLMHDAHGTDDDQWNTSLSDIINNSYPESGDFGE